MALIRDDWIVVDKPMPHNLKDGSAWVKVIVHIRKNDTGEIRKYETEEVCNDSQKFPNDFIWTDGNYACDCNRELFFGYAIGEEYGDIETECTDGRFSVNIENPLTHEIFYREFEEPIALEDIPCPSI